MPDENPQQPLWTEIDEYANAACLARDAALSEHLEAALRASDEAGLPHIQVSHAFGKYLHLTTASIGAERALEIGTLGGYSAIWLAAALPSHGRLVTLELDEHHAEVARRNVERAGLVDRVDVRVGPAVEALDAMLAQRAGEAGGEGGAPTEPFDFVFIDADKENIPAYLDRSIRLTRPGGLIVVDNVVRDGRVLHADSDDASVQGVRRMFEMLTDDDRLTATTVQTVGEKGHDGFLLAVRR